MNQYKSSAELKTQAKDLLDGHYGSAILAIFIYELIIYSVTMILNVFPAANLLWMILYQVIAAVVSAILGVFNAGIALFFLKLHCRQFVSLSDIFYGFTHLSEKAVKVSSVHALLSFVCMTPYTILTQLTLRSQSPLYLSLMFLTAAAGLLIYMPISLGLAQSYYMLLDFPQYTAAEALRNSWRAMKGHKGRLFYLEVSFIPLMALCVLTCGIGFLWLIPYMNMTLAGFYLDLMNPQKISDDQSHNAYQRS